MVQSSRSSPMQLNEPYKGSLKDLIVRDANLKDELLEECNALNSISLNPRLLCDVELLINGAFSPLEGFLNEEDYLSVCNDMRLTNGDLWPMPITLDVSSEELASKSIKVGSRIALRDWRDDRAIAIMTVSSVFQPDRMKEANLVYGTEDELHPAVKYLKSAGDYYLGGNLQAINKPLHYDYTELRYTPAELRAHLTKQNWTRYVAFQTRNPLHRAHKELTIRAAEKTDSNLLLHPVVGVTKDLDIDHFTRVKAYLAILKRYPPGVASIALLPLAMRMGGPREAVWHAIIRKNFGASVFIVGRDHAGPGKNSQGKDFYGPYEAQDLILKHKDEIEIEIMPFQAMAYIPSEDTYRPRDEITDDTKTLDISGTELRRRLRLGLHIPEWFSYPEVVKVLQDAHWPRFRQGFAIHIHGASPQQSDAVARALQARLSENGTRPVSLLFTSSDQYINKYPQIISDFVRSGSAVVMSSHSTDSVAINESKRLSNISNVFLINLEDKSFSSTTLIILNKIMMLLEKEGFFAIPSQA